MEFSKMSSFILNKLESELPDNLTYHNAEHTRMVVEVALQLAVEEGLKEEDKMLVATAALFHDAGFLSGTDDHEERSCELARDYLPEHGYSNQQIEEVCRLIKATKYPQTPGDHLERILCDADLSYLGTNSFSFLSAKLYKELKTIEGITAVEMWPEKQIQFLRAHHFYTQAAKKRFEGKKHKNLNELVKKL